MPSFDIVSEVELQEIHNAVDNANRELETRFDFRKVEASYIWSKQDITVTAEADFQLQQMLDILRNKLTKRGIDISAMQVDEPLHSGKTFSRKVTFKQGIDAVTAKKIIKLIKDKKIKVQSTIQGDQVRVSGKKKDDLQTVMTMVKDANLGQPFQFTNFRD